jgi:flagellar hook-associated protein 3 FlgL
MTRITAGMINSDVQLGIQSNGVRLDQIMSQLSSGKSIDQPSDDPVGTAKALNLHSLSSRYDQHFRNMQDGQAWITTAETALTTGNDTLQRANELGLQGANGTYGPVERANLNNEVRSLVDQILSISATTLRGQYIFSGTQTGIPPYALEHGSDAILSTPNANGNSLTGVPSTVQLFDVNRTDSTTSTGNPSAYDMLPGTISIPGLSEEVDYTVDYRHGTMTFLTPQAVAQAATAQGIQVDYQWIRRSEKDLSGVVQREVQDGQTVQVNVSADTIFGAKNETTVFDSLIALMQGLHTDSQGQVQTSLSDIQDSLKRFVQAQTVAGSRENRLQASQDQNRQNALVATKETSQVEDIDYTKLVSDYQNRQTVYQASIQVGAKIIQPSLVQFL